MTALPHLGFADRPVGRLALRRMSRQFAAVGVRVPAARLAQIAAGCPAAVDELFDVAFAETATRIRREQRHTRRVRAQRHCVHSVVVLGGTVLALAVVLGMGLVFFLMAAHASLV